MQPAAHGVCHRGVRLETVHLIAGGRCVHIELSGFDSLALRTEDPLRLGGCASAPIGVRFRAAAIVAAHHSGQKAPHRARLPHAEPHARLESRDARIRCGRAILSSSYCHRVGQPETEASARSPYRRSRPCSDSGGRLERACVKKRVGTNGYCWVMRATSLGTSAEGVRPRYVEQIPQPAWMDMYRRNANHLNVLHRMYFNQKM
jgi:hypothetical protein